VKWLIVADFHISRAEPFTKIILAKLIQLIHTGVARKDGFHWFYAFFIPVKVLLIN